MKLTIRNEFIIIAGLGLLLLALIMAGIQGLPAPLPVVRLLLGLFFVLFVPGYSLQAALFPRAGSLDGPERLALSFGLSVAIVPPLALILDQLPWGLRLWPIVLAEGLFISMCALIAWIRRRRLLESERFFWVIQMDGRAWWASQDRTNRLLYTILIGALLLAVSSAMVIILLPKPGELFTEFYVLGPEGLAENYPREVAAGQPVTLTLGVANLEGEPGRYGVLAMLDDQQIGMAGPFDLPGGQTWEGELLFSMPSPGEDQKVDILLVREGQDYPYRSLRLWLDVVE